MAISEQGIRSYLDGEVSLAIPARHELIPPRGGDRAAGNRTRLRLIACSRCLRVLHDETWIRAETAIRELRSFEYDAPPHFEPVLCPICTRSIQLHRGQARGAVRRHVARPRGRR
jgi:hypothetical protein